MHPTTLLGLLAAAVTVSARPRHHARSCSAHGVDTKCPIVFDGRVKTTTQLTDFDSYATSIFNPDYVKGQNLKWSDIIKFPTTANARFDNATYKPFEVTISDQSIFQTQRGFRRAGLQFQGDTNNGSPGSKGVKTLHFSLKWDAQRALNLSHEYLLVWHEAADYSSNQFNFEAGAILGQANLPKDTYKVLDRNNKQIWSTPILKDAWQNFAVTLDFNKKCVLPSFVCFETDQTTDSPQHPPSVLLQGRRAAQERHERRVQQQRGRRPVPDRHAQEADRHQRRRQLGLPREQPQRGPHLRQPVPRGQRQQLCVVVE
jgi:hypothetical protein